MYAERKNINLESVYIELIHNRNSKKKFQDTHNKTDRADMIDGYIGLKGDLKPDQHQRLLEIASRCWMYRTLNAGVSIRFHPLKTKKST